MKTKFKQTEIGKIPEDWEVTNLAEVITINPKRNLKKGVKAKYVSMQDLKEYNKKIQKYLIREFKGGSKFINGDTIMARITPCLENGKTAFVDILGEGEIGFGSTEFIVLCGKNGKTTNDFVYYLSISPQLRAQAINSMTGTSGRQRVQVDLLGTIEILLPPLPEQKSIASIFSSLDDKIELNQRMNKTLEAIAQAIFKHWFVDFEFSNEEGKPYKSSGGEMVYNEELGKEIPKGWKVKTLKDISYNFDSKRIPLSSRERQKRQGIYPYYGATGIMDFIDDYIFDGIYILMAEDGSVIDERGYPILQYAWGKFWVNNHAHILQGKRISNEFLYLLLKNKNVQHIVTGAVQPKINQANMNSLKFAIPPECLLKSFDRTIQPLFKIYRYNKEGVKTLAQIRDVLLPKLMSGEIRVKVDAVEENV